jgi:CheY-like chemotaxis protein
MQAPRLALRGIVQTTPRWPQLNQRALAPGFPGRSRDRWKSAPRIFIMLIPEPIVLIVDDTDTDGLLMRMVFERAGVVQPARFANNGEEAIAYLNGDGGFGDREKFPLPTAVLLDLNMPRKDGFEVLKWIRQQPAFKRLRVYILSASSRDEDIERAYNLGADSYFVKPGNLAGMMQLVTTLNAWLMLTHFSP